MSPTLPNIGSTATVATPRAWWHGCWLEPGHYLFDRHGRTGPQMEPCPLGRSSVLDVPWLDGGLAPRRLRERAVFPHAWFAIPSDRIVFTRMAGTGAQSRDDRNRVERESEESPQGEFLLHTLAGCTIAAWWDRTQGDTRGACNSCLIVENQANRTWPSDEMLELFPRLFPKQAGRLAAAGVELKFLRWG